MELAGKKRSTGTLFSDYYVTTDFPYQILAAINGHLSTHFCFKFPKGARCHPMAKS